VSVPYFAYASNLGGVEADGESARLLGVARLDGHRLAFTRRSVRTGTGVADVLPAPGGVVWGAVYEVSDALQAALDRKEGAGWAYARQAVHVRLEDGAGVDAFLYVVLEKEPSEVAPSPEYVQRIVRGARAVGLPEDYVRDVREIAARCGGAGAAPS
jgi:gamma-glutamylcyclotransferase